MYRVQCGIRLSHRHTFISNQQQQQQRQLLTPPSSPQQPHSTNTFVWRLATTTSSSFQSNKMTYGRGRHTVHFEQQQQRQQQQRLHPTHDQCFKQIPSFSFMLRRRRQMLLYGLYGNTVTRHVMAAMSTLSLKTSNCNTIRIHQSTATRSLSSSLLKTARRKTATRTATTGKKQDTANDNKRDKKLRGARNLEDMPEDDFRNKLEKVNFDHSDCNSVDTSQVPVSTQVTAENTTAEDMNVPKSKSSTGSTTTKSRSRRATTATKAATNVAKSSLRQQIDQKLQRSYDDRVAQTNVYHEKCRTCPICRCEFLGGRLVMLHHLLHNYKCTKEVPTAVLNKLNELKEIADGVKYDDIVLEEKERKPKKKKKKLAKKESRKLHWKRHKKSIVSAILKETVGKMWKQ